MSDPRGPETTVAAYSRRKRGPMGNELDALRFFAPDRTTPPTASGALTDIPCPACKHVHSWHVACAVLLPHPTIPGWAHECYCGRGARQTMAKPPTRAAIPASIRAAVIARDGHICTLCGGNVYVRARKPVRRLTLDHIIPYSRGGPDTVENLRVACLSCNARRGCDDRLPPPETE